MRFDGKMLSNFENSIQKEWIITNGLGGYASSTVLGINTRKYHGLLVAALYPPGNRHVCIEKFDEEIAIGNSFYSLGANEFRDGIFPRGHEFLSEFSFSVFPKYTYQVQNVVVRKTVLNPRGWNAVVVGYGVLNRNPVGVKVRVFPFVNCRHFHSVTDRWQSAPQFSVKCERKEFSMLFDSPKSALIVSATSGHFSVAEHWIERVYFREEALRGESCFDDWYQPGFFEFEVRAGSKGDFAVVGVADVDVEIARRVLSEMPATVDDVYALKEREEQRFEGLLKRFHDEHPNIFLEDWLSWVVLATDKFVVKGSGFFRRSVVAGYYWFECWGRDTFVSLPGLLLVTGRFEDARQVFLTFKNLCRDGLIPNFVSGRAEDAAYNSVDASLWFVDAVLQFLKYTGDFKFVREQLWETLKGIVENYARGTMFGIRLDDDGLLCHGPQLTWMDAVVDGQPVTPRAGKAVEVQALWFNALKVMELLANRFRKKDEAEKYEVMADRARESFADKFWNAEKGCLFDVVGNSERDDAIRPNQVFAVALDFRLLDNTRSERVVDVVHHELLTPYGLRTLAKGDARYVGVYSGDRRSRDRAYHNGSVWAWLLGPFTRAYLKVKGYADFRREYALKNFLLPLFTGCLFEAGLGVVGEVFDGDSPHRAGGCNAQAWSVAEPLRTYVEDTMQARPKHEKTVLSDL